MAQDENYRIEKDVPLPAKRRSAEKYRFGTMEVGDSFALLTSDLKEVEAVRAAASYFGIRNASKKFAVRRVDPITKEYRCWRIA